MTADPSPQCHGADRDRQTVHAQFPFAPGVHRPSTSSPWTRSGVSGVNVTIPSGGGGVGTGLGIDPDDRVDAFVRPQDDQGQCATRCVPGRVRLPRGDLSPGEGTVSGVLGSDVSWAAIPPVAQPAGLEPAGWATLPSMMSAAAVAGSASASVIPRPGGV